MSMQALLCNIDMNIIEQKNIDIACDKATKAFVLAAAAMNAMKNTQKKEENKNKKRACPNVPNKSDIPIKNSPKFSSEEAVFPDCTRRAKTLDEKYCKSSIFKRVFRVCCLVVHPDKNDVQNKYACEHFTEIMYGKENKLLYPMLLVLLKLQKLHLVPETREINDILKKEFLTVTSTTECKKRGVLYMWSIAKTKHEQDQLIQYYVRQMNR